MSGFGKTMVGVLALSLALGLTFSGAQAYTYTDLKDMDLINYDDVWNIEPTNIAGNQIKSNSSTIGTPPDFGPTRTFGKERDSTSDGGSNTIFQNGTNTKFIHWQTPQNITLTGVNLFASLDWKGAGDPERAISTFSLAYSLDDGTTWTYLVDNWATKVGTGDPGLYTNPGGLTWRGLAAQFTFDPVTASLFKAEFTQYLGSGARVVELDAIGSIAPAPVPGALLLLGSGLLGLVGWGSFRKN